MFLNHKPTPFHQADYKAEIERELNSGRELNAFFLTHGYIEAYLRELLLISGNVEKENIDENIIKESEERISFKGILLVHSIIGNVDHKLYEKISKINQMRNELAHKLIMININDGKSKDKIKKVVLRGIEICDELSDLYKKNLDKKAKLIEKMEIK